MTVNRMNTIAIINDISKNDQTIKSYCAFATGPCGFNTASFYHSHRGTEVMITEEAKPTSKNAFSCTIENLLSPWIETMPIKQYKPINL